MSQLENQIHLRSGVGKSRSGENEIKMGQHNNQINEFELERKALKSSQTSWSGVHLPYEPGYLHKIKSSATRFYVHSRWEGAFCVSHHYSYS